MSLTPLPSLPLAIYYYSKLGFIDGFIVVTVASNLKILIHYNLGRLLRNKKINLFNLGNKISKWKIEERDLLKGQTIDIQVIVLLMVIALLA